MPNNTMNNDQLETLITDLASQLHGLRCQVRNQQIIMDAQHQEIKELTTCLENLNRYTEELNDEIDTLRGRVENNERVEDNRYEKLNKIGNDRFKYLNDAITQNSEAFVDLEDRMDVCERDSENALEHADENRTDLSDCENRLCDLEGNVCSIEEWKDEVQQETAENIEELTEFIKGQFNRLGRWMEAVDARLGGE